MESGRRNPLFYVGENIAFKLTASPKLKTPPWDRYEVRDYWGEVLEKGPVAGESLPVKSQPPGWYKLYVFGKPMKDPGAQKSAEEKLLDGDKSTGKEDAAVRNAWQFRQWYGDGIGGTMFVVVRDDPNFPKPVAEGFPKPNPAGDGVMRAVSGMGPRRHSADASKLEQTIKQLDAEIGVDKAL